MPTEDRFLKFDLAELSEALQCLKHIESYGVPDRMIVSATERKTDKGMVTCLKYGDGIEPVFIGNNVVAAALIAYCRKIKIPMQRDSKKSVAVAPGFVMLRMTSPPIAPKTSEDFDEDTAML